jgi:peroxiredoxin Q/BCP
MAAFQRDIASFEARDAQVLGVSADDVETHKRFAESLKLTFPLLVDRDDAFPADYRRGRVTYVIDKGGTVRDISSGMPDNQRILGVLDTIVHESP